ncbi:MAG: putative lipid II flippase FtsW [Candidatus Omnitrophota bacterium]|nr:putative lipid II flippase FtsW [Candidatus Omnitrophota bacterium]
MAQDLRNARKTILVVTAALISLGTIMIYSSSAVYAYDNFNDSFFFLKRHLTSLFLGLAAAVFFMLFDTEELRRHSRKFIIAAFLLLILVLVPGIGTPVAGAKRWIRAGNMSFQPVEFIKPFYVLYLADFMDRKCLKAQSISVFIPALLVICAVCGLVLLQPDMGSSFELAAIGLILLFAYGAKLKHLFFTFAASIPLIFFIILSMPYRLSRILTFMDPWRDPKGAGFQMIQSFIALGSGGLFGAGLGNSKQKLFYLPESHTDFIFSIIGEELGFIGAGFVIILFALLVWKGAVIVFKKKTEFSRLLALGITSIIGLEVVVNIAVSTGTLPTKGLPLPFVSYGGSSLVSHMVLVAILLNLGRESVR